VPCWLFCYIWGTLPPCGTGLSPNPRLDFSDPALRDSLWSHLSWKSRGKRALSKNFSVILSVCWFMANNLIPLPLLKPLWLRHLPLSREEKRGGESPSLWAASGFSRREGFRVRLFQCNLTNEKFLADAFFVLLHLKEGDRLRWRIFFYTLCLRRPTFVCQQQKWAKMPLGSLRNFK